MMMMLLVEDLMTGKRQKVEKQGFPSEDFKDGEYEATVRLEKQEDLKTVIDPSVTQRTLTYKEEKELQAEKKKLEARTKLDNLEDLEKIITLKKRKKVKKVKAPVEKEPEQEVITGPVDVPTFLKAALENKMPVIEKYLADKGDPDACDEYKRLAQGMLTRTSGNCGKLESTAIHRVRWKCEVLKFLLNKGINEMPKTRKVMLQCMMQ
ncbi:hypothetical protein E2320_008432 [Naja naja]|nr:hypothetical protein E2320_008432 [Naja naja]